MREIAASEITEAAAKLAVEATHILPEGVEGAIRVVDGFQELGLERRDLRVRMPRPALAEQRVLRDRHRFWVVPPMPTPITSGGQGFPRQVHRLAHEVDDGLLAHPGEEVLVTRHVPAAAALGHEVDADLLRCHSVRTKEAVL